MIWKESGWLSGVLLTSVPAPAAASSTERSASSERACAYNQVEGGVVLSSVFVLFHAALQSLKRQNLKTEIEEGKQERNICRGGQRAHSSLSPDHTGAPRAWQDVRHIIVVTERRPASWQTRARPSGEFPGCSAAGTLHFHARGAWIQSLVRELRFCKPHSAAKEEKKEQGLLYCQGLCSEEGKQRTEGL